MNKLSFFKKSNLNLSEEQKANIVSDIDIANFARMKLILIIFVIVEILFILFNDIPYSINSSSNIIWNDSRFLILHLLLLFVSIIGLILIKILTKHIRNRFKKLHKFLIPILTISILSLMAIINGLDQIKSEYISSVFIANLIIFSTIIMLKFPLNLAVYTVPFLTYLGELITFQHNTELLFSNIINGLIFFIAVILISTEIYNYRYHEIAKNIVLEKTIFKLNYMSSHDPLTGLLNRRSFEIQISEKMGIINEARGLAALIIIDIDYFKHVNDKFGHPIGDIALKEVSNIIIEHIRTTDLATRWGGEEFLIFLFQTSLDEAYVLADNIRLAIQNKVIQTDEFPIHITASFGVSILKDNFSNSFDASYKAADTALYKAKHQGRNQVITASLDT